MEDQSNFKISILKPCHEDWNKMTPNEKGDFCGRCAKSVVDFTKKTTKEIQEYFRSQSEKKTCGRFLSSQLEATPPPIDLIVPFYLIPKNLSLNRIFAISLFFAFGSSLFSCSTQQGEVVGKIALTDTSSHLIEPNSDKQLFKGDTIITEYMTKDKVQKSDCILLKGDDEIKSLQGEVAAAPDTNRILIDYSEKAVMKGEIEAIKKK